MKIAIIGANGQLGCDLIKKFNCSKCEKVPLTHTDIDVMNFDLSEKILRNIQRDVIIICAAYVKVDNAEIAFGLSAKDVRNLAQICAKLNWTLMHVSTDYVFDGRKRKPYTEDDDTTPINVYGNNKGSSSWFDFAKMISCCRSKQTLLDQKQKVPCFSALVSTQRIAELGMPFWEDGRRGYLNENGDFEFAWKTRR